MFLRLVRTDLKRIKYYSLYMILSAFLLLTICLCLVIKVSDHLYSTNDRTTTLSIGIVMSADSNLSQMAYAAIADMNSYRSSCDFVEVDNVQTAMSMLDNGKLFAAIYVPDNIINDIMDGTNTPVEVYYSDTGSINTFILNDLFRSTSSMLGISQAAIYSVQSIGRSMNLPQNTQNALSNDINSMFLKCVLDRTDNFVIQQINATRAANTTDFYTCAAIVLLMTMCGTVYISFVQNVPKSYVDRLHSVNIRLHHRMISSFISIFVWEYILYVAIYLALACVTMSTGTLHVHLNSCGFLYGLAITGLVSLTVTLISFIPAGVHGCSLLLITGFIVAAYLSGFFVPETMLPNFAKSICRSSLLNHMAHTLCKLICIH